MENIIQVMTFLPGEYVLGWSVYDCENMKRFQSASEKINKKREEKLRGKLPKLTQFFQSKNASVEDEDISHNISSAAGPSVAIARSSRQTATISRSLYSDFTVFLCCAAHISKRLIVRF